jgi:predicted nuclease of predicted toxin-antitoxin system
VISLLLDMGLPRRAAGDLRGHGFDTWHAGERGLAQSSDGEILEAARVEGRVIVTLDSDFAAIVATQGLQSPSVVHLRVQHLDRDRTVALLLEVLPALERDLQSGCLVSVGAGGIRVHRLPVGR